MEKHDRWNEPRCTEAVEQPALTFVVFTFNEESRIERVIQNFSEFGAILIVDNASTDRTRAIAEAYGCDILINKNSGWVEDEITAGVVKKAVRSDWIYWAYADEFVDLLTLRELLRRVKSGRFDVISVARKNYYYGRFCGDLADDRLTRVFRKDAIDFSGNKIHAFGKLISGARLHKLHRRYFVHHFISNTSKTYLDVMDRYTDTEKEVADGSLSLGRLLLVSLKMLLDAWWRGGGGDPYSKRFLLANMIYYRWLLLMKRYEAKCGLDLAEIEHGNNMVRDRLLKEFNDHPVQLRV